MNTKLEKAELDRIAFAVLGAAMEVSNTLGGGFLEKVYERALVMELRMRGMGVEPQPVLSVSYKGEHIADYSPDLIVDGKLIVELKCAESFHSEDLAQRIN